MKRRALSALVLLSAAALACQNELGPPDDYQLPPPDTSLDPAALRLGEIVFACGGWDLPGRPSDSRILVDLHFRGAATDPADGPGQASLDAVRAAGGSVLFQFAFRAARVRVDTDRIPALAAGGIVDHARAVPNPRRYDWAVIASFSRPITVSDSLEFARLGGRVTRVSQSFAMVAGILPNSSIAAYRGYEGVQAVEPDGIICPMDRRAASAGRSPRSVS